MVAPEWVVQRPHSASEWGATNRAHGIFKGRHFEATLILQAGYLRYPLSYRDIEELFLERGLAWLPLISAVLWRRSKVALG